MSMRQRLEANGERIVRAIGFAFSVVIAVRAVLALKNAWAFTTDDAYITLRYARHLADGRGLVFNVGGERVEGYSNFGLVALAALALKLQLNAETLLKLCGAAAFLGSLVLTQRLARRHLGPLLSLLPALILTEYFGSAWWAVSGLETLLAQCLLTAGLYCVDGLWAGEPSAASKARSVSLAAAGIGLPLLRPEGSVYTALLCACALGALLKLERKAELDAGAKRRMLIAIGSVALFGVAYHAFRIFYFGSALPNTVLCKMDHQGDPLELQRELWFNWSPLLLLAAIALIRTRALAHAFLLFPLLASACLFVGADPIIGYHCRHFLPALPGLAIVGTLGAREFAHFLFPSPAIGCAATATLTMLLTPHVRLPMLQGEAQAYASRQALRGRLAAFIEKELPPRARVVFGDCGLVPYRSTRHFIDAYCLNSREMTSEEIQRSPEKFADYVLTTRPEAIIVHSQSDRELVPQPYLGVWPAIVSDPRFASGYHLSAKFVNDEVACYWVFERN
ncbi:MAG: hypothetical protein QM756_13105 [Polyangiaceae bacterium]